MIKWLFMVWYLFVSDLKIKYSNGLYNKLTNSDDTGIYYYHLLSNLD